MTTENRETLFSIAVAFARPAAIALFLIVLGAFADVVFGANLTILVLTLFVSVLSITALFSKYFLKSLARALSAALMVVFLVHHVQIRDKLRFFLYETEVKGTAFRSACVPAQGIPVGKSSIRVCKVHDFNISGFVDVVVHIEGEDSPEKVIRDIYSGDVTPSAGDDLKKYGTIWEKGFTAYKLTSNYWVLRNRCFDSCESQPVFPQPPATRP